MFIINRLSKTFLTAIAIIFVVFFIFQPVHSASAALVPCGRTGQPTCTTCDLFVLASNIINFILFTITPAVAVLFFLIAGFMVLLGGANPGLVTTGRNIFKTTAYGLFIIFGSWMITNTVLKLIAGDSLFTKDWNKVTCNNPTSINNPPNPGNSNPPNPNNSNPLNPSSSSSPIPSGSSLITRKYYCDTSNSQCVANTNGAFDEPTCGGSCGTIITSPTPTPSSSVSPTSSTATLACMFNGVDYTKVNLCSGQTRPGGCGTSVCSQYSASINQYASGTATAALLKTMMVIESDCNINAATGSSYGLMQIQPGTANQFKNRCGITETITSNWLTNPVNADKSICIAAAFVNSIAGGTCGPQPKNVYAGYNAGPGNCSLSADCSNDKSCDGGAVKKWECPYDNPQHTTCNTQMYQTKQGSTYVNYCLNNLRF